MKKFAAYFLLLIVAMICLCFSSSAISKGDTVFYGKYPQSRVTSTELIEQLSAVEKTWQSYDFCSGTGTVYDGQMTASAICEYADVTLNGNRYRAVRINSYRPFVTSDKAKKDNSIQHINGYKVGQEYWFAFEPVRWKVLDSGGINLAISELSLDSQCYNDVVYCEDDIYYINNEKLVYADDFEKSTLADFLVNKFMNTAFSAQEKTELIGYPSLLDSETLAGMSSSVSIAKGSDYAKALGLFVSDDNSCWWINDSMGGINVVNGIGVKESLDGNSNFTGIGVRPIIAFTQLVCVHNYATKVTAATLTKDGKSETKCTACGKVKSSTVINKASSISLSKTSFICNNNVQKPTVTVKDSKGNTISSKYYTLTWSSGCKAVGKYSVTVKFKGNYSGSKTLSYKIIPGKVSAVNVTSDAVGSATIKYNAVAGANLYSIYYCKTKDGKYTLAKSGSKTSYTITNLTPKTKYFFKVQASKVVNEVNYKGEMSAVKYVTIKADNGIPIKNGTMYRENGFTYIKDASTGVKFLLVNKTYTVPSDYAPGGLTSECQTAFNKLVAGAKKDGIKIFCKSGYRSYSYQTTLYNNYVKRDGKAAADTYSARPGHSEHQTGLAIDCNSTSSSWATTKEAKWLAAHCMEYGFIIRYDKGKQSKTGYIYEAWHIRYIGSVELAKKLSNSGLCIEEYYGVTSKY